jgi:hypothetical protein
LYSFDMTIRQLMIGGIVGTAAFSVGLYRLSKTFVTHESFLTKSVIVVPNDAITITKAEKPAPAPRTRARDLKSRRV